MSDKKPGDESIGFKLKASPVTIETRRVYHLVPALGPRRGLEPPTDAVTLWANHTRKFVDTLKRLHADYLASFSRPYARVIAFPWTTRHRELKMAGRRPIMADIDLRVRVNKVTRVTFTRGQDREFEILLSDGNTLLPINLASGQLILSLPREGGGSVKRRTSPLAFPWTTAVELNGLSVMSAPSHGLVPGEPVTLSPVGATDTLPAPFAADTTYLVAYYSADAFGLTDTLGNSIAIAASALTALPGPALLKSGDFVITGEDMGSAQLSLTALVSSVVATGQGQPYQLTFRSADNLTRIYTANALLDVFPQPWQ